MCALALWVCTNDGIDETESVSISLYDKVCDGARSVERRQFERTLVCTYVGLVGRLGGQGWRVRCAAAQAAPSARRSRFAPSSRATWSKLPLASQPHCRLTIRLTTIALRSNRNAALHLYFIVARHSPTEPFIPQTVRLRLHLVLSA